MAVTYAGYLELDRLLDLQHPRSEGPEHDEMLFIVVHQVYELWFKQLLHELDYLNARLAADDAPRALNTLKRVLSIMKVLVAQLDILETMTPLDFLSFRDRLAAGSGLQSVQFRAIEFVLGFRDQTAIERFPEGSPERARLEACLAKQTLWGAFLSFLSRAGFAVELNAPEDPSPRPTESAVTQRQLLAVYRNDPALTQLCERLVDLDEGVQEWRYRHVKMVQRTIGSKSGSGGSSGAEYLITTLFRPAFPDLWAIRSEM